VAASWRLVLKFPLAPIGAPVGIVFRRVIYFDRNGPVIKRKVAAAPSDSAGEMLAGELRLLSQSETLIIQPAVKDLLPGVQAGLRRIRRLRSAPVPYLFFS
jgi:hypothetical protein